MEPFRFSLTQECSEKISAIRLQAETIAEQAMALPTSDFELLKPILENVFGLLSGLGDNLVLIEGDGEFKATATNKK